VTGIWQRDPAGGPPDRSLPEDNTFVRPKSVTVHQPFAAATPTCSWSAWPIKSFGVALRLAWGITASAMKEPAMPDDAVHRQPFLYGPNPPDRRNPAVCQERRGNDDLLN
jgi:hypothetical protein